MKIFKTVLDVTFYVGKNKTVIDNHLTRDTQRQRLSRIYGMIRAVGAKNLSYIDIMTIEGQTIDRIMSFHTMSYHAADELTIKQIKSIINTKNPHWIKLVAKK
jgi:hypothetical protein